MTRKLTCLVPSFSFSARNQRAASAPAHPPANRFTKAFSRIHEGLPANSRRPSHGFTKAFSRIHEGLLTDSRRPSHGFTKAFSRIHEGLPTDSRRPSHGFTKAFSRIHEGLLTDSRRPSLKILIAFANHANNYTSRREAPSRPRMSPQPFRTSLKLSASAHTKKLTTSLRKTSCQLSNDFL